MLSMSILARPTSLVRLAAGKNNQLRRFASQGISKSQREEVKTTSSEVRGGDVTFGLVSDELRVRHGIERPTLHADKELEKDGLEAYEAKLADTSRPRPADYLREINRLVRENKLQAALKVIDEDMRRELVRPGVKHFRVLIHECGKIGYVTKAFQLYADYSGLGLDYNQGIIADLFNACANSPKKQVALYRANLLRRKMSAFNVNLSQVVYHNMIKAFGRCGDLQTAFSLLDEMKSKRVPIDSYTFAMLLQGCISDTRSGFRHAILVTRIMLEMRVPMDQHTFQLLLRACKDCGVGEERFTYDLLLACMTSAEARKHRLQLETGEVSQLASGEKRTENGGLDAEKVPEQSETNRSLTLVADEEKAKNLEVTREASLATTLPNLLSRKPNFSNVVAVGAIDTPAKRFQLMGGVEGFLGQMKAKKVKADAKAFTQMLPLIEPTEEAELELLNTMQRTGVQPNGAFFNNLIKRRNARRDHKSGLAVLALMHEHGAEVDLVTYMCLANSCKSNQETFRLIEDLEAQDIRLNAEIAGVLIKNAGLRQSPRDVHNLLKVAIRHGVRPNADMLNYLEIFYRQFHDNLIAYEKFQVTKVPMKYPLSRKALWEVKEGFPYWRKFVELYSDWLKTTEADLPGHPWEQYLTSRDLERSQKNSKFDMLAEK